MSDKERNLVPNNENDKVFDGSGNVFEDLGLPLSQDDYLKIGIAREITKQIEVLGLTQKKVAVLIGANQAQVSKIVRGRLDEFSVDRLVRYLTDLGFDIDLHLSRPLKSRKGGSGKVTVHPPIAL